MSSRVFCLKACVLFPVFIQLSLLAALFEVRLFTSITFGLAILNSFKHFCLRVGRNLSSISYFWAYSNHKITVNSGGCSESLISLVFILISPHYVGIPGENSPMTTTNLLYFFIEEACRTWTESVLLYSSLFNLLLDRFCMKMFCDCLHVFLDPSNHPTFPSSATLCDFLSSHLDFIILPFILFWLYICPHSFIHFHQSTFIPPIKVYYSLSFDKALSLSSACQPWYSLQTVCVYTDCTEFRFTAVRSDNPS